MTYIDDAARRIDEERARWQAKKDAEKRQKQVQKMAEQKLREKEKRDSSVIW